MMVDCDHRAIHRACNAVDRRVNEEARGLQAQVGGNRILEVSGYCLEYHNRWRRTLPVSTGVVDPTLVNLLSEMRHRPEGFEQASNGLMIDGCITSYHTGETSLHYSGATF